MQNFISIPTPCHENWDAMTPQQQGRHCAKCNIVVADFSAMSNEEILQFLNKKEGRVCGRVNSEQLCQPPTLTTKLKKFIYAFALVFLPFVPLDSLGQEKSETQIEQNVEYGTIEGKVVNEKGEAVPFASIGAFQGTIVKGHTKTDINGMYKIQRLKKGLYTLQVSSVGYNKLTTKEIEVSAGKNSVKNIIMTRGTEIIRTIVVGQLSPLPKSGK